MFVEETLWIKGVLQEELTGEGYEILEIGSSSLEFRTEIQPHINSNIHRPLVNRGCSITHADIKNAPGVDIVVDLSKQGLPETLFEKKYDLVICCNILEHVADRDIFLKNLSMFVKNGGHVLFTVPRRYPKHNDPIDTMFRPTPKSLLKCIDKYMKVKACRQAILSITQKEYYLYKPGRTLDYLTCKPLWRVWRYYLKPFRWQVSCLLAKVDEGCEK